MTATMQKDVIAAVQREAQEGPRVVQIDGIIDALVAEHGEENRNQITDMVVRVVRARGAAAVWTQHSRK